MPAHQNAIVIVPRCWDAVREVLRNAKPFIEVRLGSFSTRSVLNYSTGTVTDGEFGNTAASDLSETSDSEILTLYGANQARGAVVISREGSFDIVTISLAEHAPALDLLRELWRIVGREALAVLAGEELEVDAVQLAELVSIGAIPQTMDQCEAAIVKTAPRTERSTEWVDEELAHGGHWIRG